MKVLVDVLLPACILKVCPARISTRPVEDPLTHYVIVRVDLPMGVAAAQITHAAGESSPGHLPAGTFAVVLGVPDAMALMQLADRLRHAGVEFVCIFETDPPWSGQLMAIGVRPARRSKMRKLFSSIPLYRGPTIAGVAQQQSAGQSESRSPEAGGAAPSSRSNGSVAQGLERRE